MGATATLMIPTTTGSELARRLREVVTHHPGPRGTSLKICEIPGKPLMTGLKKAPSVHNNCHNMNCPLESSGQECKDQCRIENIIYKAVCRKCDQNQINGGENPEKVTSSIYIGETSRTLGVRSNQHKDDYLKCMRNSPLEEGSSFIYDHQVAFHNTEQIDPLRDYTFSMLEKTADPFTRQIKEAILIQESLDSKTFNGKKVISLNRKHEYFQARRRPLTYE